MTQLYHGGHDDGRHYNQEDFISNQTVKGAVQ
jgi:hypothetical protein